MSNSKIKIGYRRDQFDKGFMKQRQLNRENIYRIVVLFYILSTFINPFTTEARFYVLNAMAFST